MYCYLPVQVLHGADGDVVWLQRDFGVYIVGLFDTHQGSRALGFARHRLQDLLQHYCGVEASKEFQLEDWRIRYFSSSSCISSDIPDDSLSLVVHV